MFVLLISKSRDIYRVYIGWCGIAEWQLTHSTCPRNKLDKFSSRIMLYIDITKVSNLSDWKLVEYKMKELVTCLCNVPHIG